MIRSLFSILSVCTVLSHPAYCLNLNDPVLSDTSQTWEKVSSDINTCFVNGSSSESLCFVVDRGEYHEPVFLTLSQPEDRGALTTFLEECEKVLKQMDKENKTKRAGLIVIGQSPQGQVREWLDRIAAQQPKSSNIMPLAIFGHPPVQTVTESSIQSPHLILSYNFHLPSPRTYRELRKLWVMELIQQMTFQRLAKEGVCEVHNFDAREFLLPAKNLQILLPYEEQNWQKSLQFSLQKMKEITDVGFTHDELQVAKRECLFLVQEMQKEKIAHPALCRATFEACRFLRDLSPLSYTEYLDSATPLLDSITPVDIAIVMHESFTRDERTLSYVASQRKNTDWIADAQLVIDFVEKEESQRIAYLRTEMESPNIYQQLPLHDDEKAIIYKIIDTMARENVIKLGWKRKTMEKKGKKIRHVHPLRFLGHVFADRHLKHCMREISRSSFKWNGFIDGMKDRIEEEASRGNLLPYVHDFAQYVHCDENKARRYLEKRDWDGFVRFLL